MLQFDEEVGELSQAYLARTGQARNKGSSDNELDADFCAELADVFAQALLLAERFDVDVAVEVERNRLVWKPAR